MKKINITILLISTLLVACSSNQIRSRNDYVNMTSQTPSSRQYIAIQNRCSELGNRAQSAYSSNLDASSISEVPEDNRIGYAALFAAASIFSAASEYEDTFDECMAKHGFYPN